MKNNKNDLLRQAFIEADIEYFDNVTKQEDVEWVPSAEFKRRMEYLIRRNGQNSFNWWKNNLKKVACVILMFAILISATLSVEAIRTSIIDFCTKMFEKFSSVFVSCEDDCSVPSYIETEYLPTLVQYEYRIGYQNQDPAFRQTVYIHESNPRIIFTQQVLGQAHFLLDTEGAELYDISIGSQKGQYFINKRFITISWTAQNYVFCLSVPDCYTLAEAVKMAESLTD